MARILVIDDDEFVRGLMARLLGRQGHTVTCAPDGAAGLEAFRQGRYDLIITDIIMPEMEGIEFIVNLREEDPEVPLMAISGGSDGTGPGAPLHDARLLGADATLAKPFEVDILIDTVEALLVGPRFNSDPQGEYPVSAGHRAAGT